MLVEIHNSSIPESQPAEEDRLENLLSEKLMEGYQLDENACPKCSAPLVKMEKNPFGYDVKELDAPVLIPNRNPEKPFAPKADVPVCVSCNAHVVTNEYEVNILTGKSNKCEPSSKREDASVIDLTTIPSGEEADMVHLPYSVRHDDKPERNTNNFAPTAGSYDEGRVREEDLIAKLEHKREEQAMYEQRVASKSEVLVDTIQNDIPSTIEHPEARDDVEESVRSQTPTILDLMLKREQQEQLEEEYRATLQKRREEEMILMEETKRIVSLEEEYTVGTIRTTDVMQRDLLVDQHRKRLAAKAQLDEDVLKLEQMRLVEEMEHRRMTEERRVEDEAERIKQLEEKAAAKAKEAEEAQERAKQALEEVDTARKDIIAQTIAIAEAEVVAEVEECLKSEIEQYKEPAILPTSSEIEAEQWETLRFEGRTIMTRRVMSGWSILAEFCRGTECDNCPLIMKNGKKECCVCGGCGDGTDGAYARGTSADSGDEDDEAGHFMPQRPLVNTLAPSMVPLYPVVQNIQNAFDARKEIVTEEMNKKMLEGWTLLDSTCPTCFMPMMTDTKGLRDVCISCEMDAVSMNQQSIPPVPSIAALTARDTADPPANVPSYDESEAEMTISIPKNFDFNDQAAIINLIHRAASKGNQAPADRAPVDPLPGKARTPLNQEIIDLCSYPSLDEEDERAEMIAMMFMESTYGAQFQSSDGSIDMDDDLNDLVEIYVQSNFGPALKEQIPGISRAVWKKMRNLIASNAAEALMSTTPRSEGPPKPESRPGTPRRSRPTTPKDGESFFDEGDNDLVSMGEQTAKKLEDILSKIEQCKEALNDDDMGVEKQMEAAERIEQLSKAALAVQGFEENEDDDV